MLHNWAEAISDIKYKLELTLLVTILNSGLTDSKYIKNGGIIGRQIKSITNLSYLFYRTYVIKKWF